MSIHITTISAFCAIVGISGVSAGLINNSIAPATAASSLVTYADYVLQDGRCYATGRKFSRVVDKSMCAPQRGAH
jgi:hypothetical protein